MYRIASLTILFMIAACGSTPKSVAPTAMEKVAWGDRALASGDEASALRHYMGALLLDDQDQEIFYKVGTLQKRRGNKVAAISAYRHALKLAPDHMPIVDGLAMLLIDADEIQAARMLVERMQELQPDSWRVPYAWGLIALADHEFGRAEYQFTKSLEKSPGNSEITMRRGRAHLLNNRFEEALLDLTKLLENPRYRRQAQQNLGILYLKKKEYPQALASFTETAGEANAYTNVGQAAMLQGDIREAEFYLREALRVSPTYNVKAAEQLKRLTENVTNSGSTTPTSMSTSKRYP